MIDGLNRELTSLLAERQPSRLLVCCNGVKMMTSESINALLGARQRLHKSDGDIVLCDVRPHVLQVFKLLKLCGRIFRIYDDEAEAIKDFAAVGPSLVESGKD